ncbi:hypothetical protein NKI89_30265 [Mesorhizobium sp. M0309]|uniref:hypothetical protein n=1 Tax=unclassified Mesorhizobium TaxID=325217 RepID=UPI0003D06DAB|nr:hypothetical protein [Mesorhizobium sp. L103C131B0]ESZ54428.1 hypothetical protein X729_28655 [Mesorhizobium sp. L103C131B0]
MEEILPRIATGAGIGPAVAEKAVGLMLGFLRSHAADGPGARMIEAIPGASELVAKYRGDDPEGGGLMGLGQQLMSEGLSMAKIAALANETIACAKEHAGDELVDEVLNSVPGLPQFV